MTWVYNSATSSQCKQVEGAAHVQRLTGENRVLGVN